MDREKKPKILYRLGGQLSPNASRREVEELLRQARMSYANDNMTDEVRRGLERDIELLEVELGAREDPEENN